MADIPLVDKPVQTTKRANRRARRHRHLSEQQALPRRWVSIQDVADHLAVTERTVRAMIADGRITGYRNGRRLIRIDLNEVDAKMTAFGGGAA